jgi:ATP-binding cassette subfamily B protein
MFGNRRMIGGLGMPSQKAKNFKGTLTRLLGYLRPHRAGLSVVILAGAIGTVFNVLGPKILGMATTKIFEGFVAKALNVPGAAIDFGYVGRILLGLIGLYLVGNTFQYLMQHSWQCRAEDGPRAREVEPLTACPRLFDTGRAEN